VIYDWWSFHFYDPIWGCLLKIDDIEDENEDEITTQQSRILDNILSFLEQIENKNSYDN